MGGNVEETSNPEDGKETLYQVIPGTHNISYSAF